MTTMLLNYLFQQNGCKHCLVHKEGKTSIFRSNATNLENAIHFRNICYIKDSDFKKD